MSTSCEGCGAPLPPLPPAANVAGLCCVYCRRPRWPAQGLVAQQSHHPAAAAQMIQTQRMAGVNPYLGPLGVRGPGWWL